MCAVCPVFPYGLLFNFTSAVYYSTSLPRSTTQLYFQDDLRLVRRSRTPSRRGAAVEQRCTGVTVDRAVES